MKTKLLLIIFLFLSVYTQAQVGIGVTNPLFPLDVKGTIRMRYDSTNGDVPRILFNNISNPSTTFPNPGVAVQYENDSTLSISRNSTSGLSTVRKNFVFDHNNVRLGLQDEGAIIGIANLMVPEAAIHIANFDSIGVLLDFNSPGNTSSAKNGIAMRAGGFYSSSIRSNATSSSGSKFAISTGSNTSLNSLTERYTVLENGYTGFSQPNPLTGFHFRHSDSASVILERSTPIATGVKNAVYFKTGNYYTGGIATRAVSGNSASLAFYTYADPTITELKERMTILDNGNVGINVSSPAAKLDVEGSLRFRTGAGANKVLTSDANGNATWQDPSVTTGYGARVGNNVLLAIPLSNTPLVLRLAYTGYDDGNLWNDSIFTAPVAGVYHFSLALDVSYSYINAADDNLITVYTQSSGGSLFQSYTVLPNNTGGIASTLFLVFDEKLNQGDTYKFKVARGFSTSGNAAVQLNAYDAVLSIHRVY